jgi:hypothetical protein
VAGCEPRQSAAHDIAATYDEQSLHGVDYLTPDSPSGFSPDQGDYMNEENISPQRREGTKGRKEGRRRLSNGLFCLIAFLPSFVPRFLLLFRIPLRISAPLRLCGEVLNFSAFALYPRPFTLILP